MGRPPRQSKLFRSDPEQSDFALPEGLEAGLVSGLAVAAVFLIRDMSVGNWLHTPTVLGTLLVAGPAEARTVVSAPGVAAAYNVIHFAAWVGAGFVTGLMVRGVEQRKADSRLLLGAWIAFVVLSWIALDSWVRESGLARTHLWTGGVVGAIALAGFFAWRHPALWRREAPAEPD